MILFATSTRALFSSRFRHALHTERSPIPEGLGEKFSSGNTFLQRWHFFDIYSAP